MHRAILLTLISFVFTLTVNAQIVSLSPTSAGPEDEVTVIFDATEGNAELEGADKVYMHHGVVTDAPDGTSWQYVIGSWGQDNGIGEMTRVAGETDKWQITFSPSIRNHFGVPDGENIYRISCVFRNADGSTKGTISPGTYGWGEVASNLDFYIDLNVDNYIDISSPLGERTFAEAGDNIAISAYASSSVSSMAILLDSGNGYEEQATVSSGTTINYNYPVTATTNLNIKVTATVNGENLEIVRQHEVVVPQPNVIEDLPAGVIAGINYHDDDDTKATLVLEAPHKEYAYVVGDFNNWSVQDQYQMKQTPDGEFYWLEISGLTPQEEYVFQYWVNGDIKIGDPYADKIADPWNDQWITDDVYPNLPEYDKTDYQMASVLQTGQTPYQWNTSEDSWERPDLDQLVIYELHVRDFVGSHTYAELIDSLEYLQKLGINAIELMPVNEFEGNDSWGYNPAYYFAPDKYYGPKDELKRLIETAHQMDMAVIMDIVLNHAYGQNPMLKLYFDQSANKPAFNNPWFNREYVGQYQWGYDFNHESTYTQAFVDRVNAYWLEEYHFDGYRFDFTKGFTNYAPGGSIDGFDQSRINILKRMTDEIRVVDPNAYVILEHWGPAAEENQLAAYGIKMWRNRSYDYVPAATANPINSFGSMDDTSHVSYFDSHDEQRLAYHILTEGRASGDYDTKNPLIMYERMKMAAAFTFLFPGPKMIWQFDELGYDIDIDFNGRVGAKPQPWGVNGLGYYEDSLRQYIYDAYAAILDLRTQLEPAILAQANTNNIYNGAARRLSYDTDGIDMVLIGNFATTTNNIDPYFSETGTWYDYFSGEEINITSTHEPIDLSPGEWHIFTSERLSDGFEGVVEVFQNPVTIAPNPFTVNDEIVIRFDATKASKNGTQGLVGADKVYMHSGVLIDHPDSTSLSHVVGTFTDDGLGEMTEVEEDIWEITITPADYYNIDEALDVYQLGMYFRDANNENQGMGYRNSIIYFNVDSDLPFVSIEPWDFDANTEITITFNAKKGNRELVGADKIYMHSGMITVDTQSPESVGWQNVVGDWGQDNGIGQMTPVNGTNDIWEITLTPKDYYGLVDGEFPYWLSAVFRNADGSKKGTGAPGPITNGYIATNLDFFIMNQGTNASRELLLEGIEFFPNPTNGVFTIQGIDEDYIFTAYNMDGRMRLQTKQNHQNTLDISSLGKGMYFFRIESEGKFFTGKIVVE